ncbi:unnamed protein product [Spirodela intermedia]|uniref:Uncharacterized protein n=2 Tax=Spirodela intermedia TaxID=51605 RepID=A0A7I8IGZ4_SPIIN|nr:unnamed protein product [Spirodela intermedia]CAA6656973.1 unnamed protein product [Spirodela intermedia]CAA7392950.1 unnamed protein product [Spirodela intermedia]CAB1184508.1 unnamed protein product [Spirodela intermedia]
MLQCTVLLTCLVVILCWHSL